MIYLTESLAKKEFRNFLREKQLQPRKCTSLDQVRKSIGGLCKIIADFQLKYSFVPEKAYILLSEYNRLQNEMIARAGA